MYAATYGRSAYKMNIAFDILANNDPSLVSWSMAPNPARERVQLQWQDTVESLIIYDALGREMETIQLQGQEHSLDVSSWAAGVYFLRLGNTTKRLVGN